MKRSLYLEQDPPSGDFASRYYGIDSLLAGSQVNPAACKTLYPIHVFDVSKQRGL